MSESLIGLLVHSVVGTAAGLALSGGEAISGAGRSSVNCNVGRIVSVHTLLKSLVHLGVSECRIDLGLEAVASVALEGTLKAEYTVIGAGRLILLGSVEALAPSVSNLCSDVGDVVLAASLALSGGITLVVAGRSLYNGSVVSNPSLSAFGKACVNLEVAERSAVGSDLLVTCSTLLAEVSGLGTGCSDVTNGLIGVIHHRSGAILVNKLTLALSADLHRVTGGYARSRYNYVIAVNMLAVLSKLYVRNGNGSVQINTGNAERVSVYRLTIVIGSNTDATRPAGAGNINVANVIQRAASGCTGKLREIDLIGIPAGLNHLLYSVIGHTVIIGTYDIKHDSEICRRITVDIEYDL